MRFDEAGRQAVKRVLMSYRCPASTCTLAIVMAVGFVASLPVAGQTRTAAADTWTPPRTTWDDPDLQGIWNNLTSTPLQRTAELAGKEFFTEEEALEFAKQTLQRVDRDRRDGGAEADVGRAYNEFWSDRQAKYLDLPNRRTSLVVDPPDGRVPPLTPMGQARLDARTQARQHPAASWEDRNLWERCITRGLPRIPGSYNNNFLILQTPGYIVILVEMIHETRIIPLDGRPHLSSHIRQWMGDSRGRWEGNTLVIETTNFTDNQEFRGTSKNLRLVEQFTRVDADTIDYRFTIDDPTTYARPWTVALPMNMTGERIFEYACHEGNYGMVGILGGARAQEKTAEEATQK